MERVHLLRLPLSYTLLLPVGLCTMSRGSWRLSLSTDSLTQPCLFSTCSRTAVITGDSPSLSGTSSTILTTLPRSLEIYRSIPPLPSLFCLSWVTCRFIWHWETSDLLELKREGSLIPQPTPSHSSLDTSPVQTTPMSFMPGLPSLSWPNAFLQVCLLEQGFSRWQSGPSENIRTTRRSSQTTPKEGLPSFPSWFKLCSWYFSWLAMAQVFLV